MLMHLDGIQILIEFLKSSVSGPTSVNYPKWTIILRGAWLHVIYE